MKTVENIFKSKIGSFKFDRNVPIHNLYLNIFFRTDKPFEYVFKHFIRARIQIHFKSIPYTTGSHVYDAFMSGPRV